MFAQVSDAAARVYLYKTRDTILVVQRPSVVASISIDFELAPGHARFLPIVFRAVRKRGTPIRPPHFSGSSFFKRNYVALNSIHHRSPRPYIYIDRSKRPIDLFTRLTVFRLLPTTGIRVIYLVRANLIKRLYM